MRLIPLTEAFRAVVRAWYPVRPALADEIQSVRYFHSAWCHCRLRRLNPEVQIADEAMAALIDGIMSGAVRLRAILGDNQPDDIEPMEVAWNGIHVFDNTMEVYGEGGRTLRTYRNVRCYAADIAALTGVGAAVEPTPEQAQRWKTPTDEAVRVKLREAYSEAKTAGTRAPNINEIPKIVRPKLNADGYDAADIRIKTIAEEPAFRALRGRTGVRAT
jgi:hypothetical protein